MTGGVTEAVSSFGGWYKATLRKFKEDGRWMTE